MKRVGVGDIQLATIDRGEGLPLLLVHGFPLDHSMWAAQIEALDNTCRVIAPDLRGFGQSDVSEGTVPMAWMADDLAELLDGMDVAEPVVFCGLSMGGYIGWEFFKRHRQRLRALILCDTRAVCDTPEAAQTRRETAANVVTGGPQGLIDGMVPKLFAKGTVESGSKVIARTRDVMGATAPAGIAAALLGMAERIDANSLLPEIDCPTLVVVGEEDAISTVEEMRSMADAIPNAQLVEVPGAGHMSPLEAPDTVNKAILEFLASLN